MSDFSSQMEEEQNSEVEFEQGEESQENQSNQELEKSSKRLEIEQDGKDLGMGSYVFYDEDHTLGNALRYVLTKRHETQFVGYSIPHPSENRMVIRLQCVQGKKSNEVFKKGLNSLNNLCSNLISKLEAEQNNFQKRQSKQKKNK